METKTKMLMMKTNIKIKMKGQSKYEGSVSVGLTSLKGGSHAMLTVVINMMLVVSRLLQAAAGLRKDRPCMTVMGRHDGPTTACVFCLSNFTFYAKPTSRSVYSSFCCSSAPILLSYLPTACVATTALEHELCSRILAAPLAAARLRPRQLPICSMRGSTMRRSRRGPSG